MSTTTALSAMTPPKSRMDYYDHQSVANYRRVFLQELRIYYPKLYKLVVFNTLIHPGSGMRVVGSDEDLTAARTPSAAPPGFATPRRRSVPASTDPAPTLTTAERKLIMHAPHLMDDADAQLASLILLSQTVQTAIAVLHDACGDSGRAMLLHLDTRIQGAKGSPAQLAAHDKLTDLVRAGPGTFGLAAWQAYSTAILQQTATAQVASDEETMGRLRAAFYHWPPAECTAALAAANSASTPQQVVTAVTTFVDNLASGRSHTQARRPAPTAPYESGNAVLATKGGFGTDPQYHFPPGHERRHSRIPEPTAPSADAAAAALRRDRDRLPWNPHTDKACRNWRNGRSGCDGRHHLPHCPLPRPVGIVCEATSDDEDAPPPAADTVAPPAAPAMPVGGVGGIVDMGDPAALRDFALMIGKGDGPTDFVMPTSRPVLTVDTASTGMHAVCALNEPVYTMPPIMDTFDSVPSYVRPSYLGEMAFALV